MNGTLTRRGLLAGAVSAAVTGNATAGILPRFGGHEHAAGGGGGTPDAVVATVTNHAADRIFQRVGTTKTITFAGTYTGTVVDAIEVQIVDGTSGATVQDWTALGSLSAAAGAWSGTLSVPEGCWYKFKARVAGNPATVSTSTNQFGVGLLVALIGQSNMGNFYALNNVTAPLNAKTRRWAGAGWFVTNTSNQPGENAMFYTAYAAPTVKYFADTLQTKLAAAGHDIPVGFIPVAVGGTSIAQWLPVSGGGTAFSGGISCYDNFVNVITNSSCGSDCEIALWYQGEADVGQTKAYYTGKLTTLHNNLLTLTGRSTSTFKFGIATLGSDGRDSTIGGDGSANNTATDPIRQAHIDYATNTTGAFYAATALDGLHNTGDGLHLTAGLNATVGYESGHPSSQSHLSNRYVQSCLKALGYAATGGEGPYISSATFTPGSSIIKCQVTHSGGTALQDGTGNASGTGILGFRVTVSGAAQSVSTADIVGNEIWLTCGAVMSATAPVVQYGYGSSPWGWQYGFTNFATVTDKRDHVVYDNQSSTITGDVYPTVAGLGFPLRPSLPITAT